MNTSIWQDNGSTFEGRLPVAFYARAESHAPELLIELGERAFVALVDEANLGATMVVDRYEEALALALDYAEGGER